MLHIATIFIGYPLDYKGYKLLDIKTRKPFISRDVKFHENIFPFQHNTNLDVMISILLFLIMLPLITLMILLL